MNIDQAVKSIREIVATNYGPLHPGYKPDVYNNKRKTGRTVKFYPAQRYHYRENKGKDLAAISSKTIQDIRDFAEMNQIEGLTAPLKIEVREFVNRFNPGSIRVKLITN